MKILIFATETIPYFKIGSLADVVYGFAKELNNQAHDARIIVPRYRSILSEPPSLETVIKELQVDLGDLSQYVEGQTKPRAYYRLANILKSPALPVTYFVDQDFYFGRDNLYNYPDDYERFIFFGLAALYAVAHPDFQKNEPEEWIPDIIQGFDWAAGLMPSWLQTLAAQDKRFEKTRFVLTIHNIRRQGIFGSRSLQLARQDQDGIYPEIGEKDEQVNFLGRGILFSDKVVTVNPHFDDPQFDNENQITNPLGNRNPLPEPALVLKPILEKRLADGDLVGIRNGIDEDDYDPARGDPRIVAHFTPSTLKERVKNKLALQELLGFAQNENIPLLAMVSRLIPNNGYELLQALYDNRSELKDFQLVILADSGVTETRDLLRKWEEEQDPARPWIKSRFSYDESLARQIFAGCDLFLMPAKESPSGINQLISMRYGAVPLVYHTGALCESVVQYQPGIRVKEGSGIGIGFKFYEYTPEAFLKAVVSALEVYHNPAQTAWRNIQLINMRQRFNWGQPVSDYLDLYEKALDSSRVSLYDGQKLNLNRDARLLQAILEIDSLPGLGMREKGSILRQVGRIIRGVLECDAVYVWEIGEGSRLEALEPSLDYSQRKAKPDMEQVNRLLNQNTLNLWGSVGDADLNGTCQPIKGLEEHSFAKQEGWVDGKSVPIVAHGHLLGRVDVLFKKKPKSEDNDWQVMALTALTSSFGQRWYNLLGAKELDDISSMANEFMAARSFKTVVDLVTEWALKLTEAEHVWLYFKQGDKLELISPPDDAPGVEAIAQNAFDTGLPLSLVDWIGAPRMKNGRRVYRSLMAIPLMDPSTEAPSKSASGVLVLVHSEPARFRHDHQQVLEKYLSPQAALSLASSTWYQERDQKRIRDIEGIRQILLDFSRKLTDLYGVLVASQDRQKLMTNIVEKISDVIGVDAASLFLADAKREKLTIQAASGYQKKLMDANPQPFYLWGKGVTGRIAADDRPFKADSLRELREKGGGSTQGNYDSLQDGRQPEFFYGMPLSVEGEKRPIGVLKVERLKFKPSADPNNPHEGQIEQHPFTEEDVLLITMMGKVIATVVYNAQITEQKLANLSNNLQDMSTVLVGSQDRQKLMTDIVKKIIDVIGVDAASLFLADEKREKLTIQAASGYQEKLMSANPKPEYQWGKGVTGRIAADNRPFKADSLRELREKGGSNRGNFDDLQDSLQPNSFYGMPLSVEGEKRPIGVLKVERLEQRPFTEEEVLLITMMGNVIATVVYNAQISEQKLADFSMNIRRLSLVLTPGAQVNQQTWFQKIVDTISLMFVTDAASLYLVDESNKRLVIEAASGYQEPLKAAKAFYEWGEGVTGKIAKTGDPARADTLAALRAQGTAKRGKYDDLQGGNQPNSYYGVPLKVSGEEDPIGVLKFESKRENYFSDENRLLIDMMANVIATVIHNNRQSEKHIGGILQEMGTLQSPLDASAEVLQRYAKETDAGLVNQLALALSQDLGSAPAAIEAEARLIFEARKQLDTDLRADLFNRIASWARFMKYERAEWQFSLYNTIWRSNPEKYRTWADLDSSARPWLDLKDHLGNGVEFNKAAAKLVERIVDNVNQDLNNDERPLTLHVDPSESRQTWFQAIVDSEGVFGEQVKNLLMLFQRTVNLDDIGQMDLDDLVKQNKGNIYPTLLIFLWNTSLDSQQINELRSRFKETPLIKVRKLNVVFAQMVDLPHLLDPAKAKSYFRKLVLRQVTIVSPFRTEGDVPPNLFFGRDQEIKTLTHAPDAHDYAVIGNRKIGKTSLLKRVQELLKRSNAILPIFINCNAAKNTSDFYKRYMAEMQTTVPINSPQAFEQAMRDLRQKGRFPVLLIDEIDRVLMSDAGKGEPLTRTWRLLSQEGICKFIFFGSKILAQQIDNPQSDLYNFPKPIDLHYLDEETTRLVLTQPLERLEVDLIKTDEIASEVFRYTSGHPNLVQLMGDQLVEAANRRQERIILPEDVEEVGKSAYFRDEYLKRIWGDAGPLERLITLLAPGVPFELSEIEETLGKNGICIQEESAEKARIVGGQVFISREMVKNAFRMLDLFSILEEKDGVNQFIPRSFPDILHRLPETDILYHVRNEKIKLTKPEKN